MEEPTKTRPPGLSPSAGGAPALDVVSGIRRQRPFMLLIGSTTIGRASDVDVRLVADGVSRHHAKLVRAKSGAVRLVDLGAKNGTFLNGSRVNEAAVSEGDRIQIGEVVLRFGYEPRRDDAVDVTPWRKLSARELEVAELVAQGLTNPEIASRLVISRRTVATHLENVYQRLGIHSRAELSAVVAARPNLG